MTVNTELSKRIYTGNGVATDYDYNFKIPLAGDLAVSLFDLNGVELPQVLNTDYEVTGAGGDNGGKVMFTVPPPNGYTILLLSDASYTQPTDFKNQGRFFPETHENALDRITILARQNHEAITRSITLPPQVSNVSTQLPVPQVSTLFGWNGDGTAIENFPLSNIATQIAYGDKNYQVFAGTGAQVNFILSQNPGSLGNLDVSIDGVTQVPVTDYSYSGTTLTFTSAPTNGAVILVRYDQAVPVGTAISSAVTFQQSGAGAVVRSVLSKLQDTLSVKDFGAVGDGVADDTSAFQAAITKVQGTGIKLYVPAGRYRLTTRVTISDNCYIVGDGWNDVRDITGPTTRNWLLARPYGSIIFMDFTNATATEAFYVTGGGVTIESVEFEDNQGDPTSGGWTPNTNQPWAIRAYRAPFQEPGGNTIHIRNVMLRNCYQGIKLEGVLRGHLDGVYGQPLRYGIYIDGIADALRLENIHLGWTFWGGGAVYTWQLANGEGIVLGKLDNPILSNVFCFGYKNSIRCFYSTAANPVGGISRLHGTNIGLDNTFCGIKIDDACDLDLSNVYIYAGAIAGSRCIHASSVVGGIDSCAMKLSNCDLTGANFEAIRLELDGYAQISNASIRSYNQAGSGNVGIFAGDGMSVDINNIRLANGAGGALFGSTGTGVVRGEMESSGNVVYSTRVFGGTCNAGGEADFAHGLGSSLPAQLMMMQCAYKDGSNQWVQMTPVYANATNLKFAVGSNGRPYRATILYSPQSIPGW